MNLREYAEQAVPLLQALVEGKKLEYLPRLGCPGLGQKWATLGEAEGVLALNLEQYEFRVKVEAPDTMLVQVHSDGCAGGAWGPNEMQPNPETIAGRLFRYVREDLVPKEQLGAAQIRAAKVAADEQYDSARQEDRRTYSDYIAFR